MDWVDGSLVRGVSLTASDHYDGEQHGDLKHQDRSDDENRRLGCAECLLKRAGGVEGGNHSDADDRR